MLTGDRTAKCDKASDNREYPDQLKPRKYRRKRDEASMEWRVLHNVLGKLHRSPT
jgi:hypothetical protein